MPQSRTGSFRCPMRNRKSVIWSLNEKLHSCGKRTIYSRTHSVFHKRLEKVKTSERHPSVNEFRLKYEVNAICRSLKISESGYYHGIGFFRNLDLTVVKLVLYFHEKGNMNPYRSSNGAFSVPNYSSLARQIAVLIFICPSEGVNHH